jgi:hypothetical protein
LVIPSVIPFGYKYDSINGNFIKVCFDEGMIKIHFFDD